MLPSALTNLTPYLPLNRTAWDSSYPKSFLILFLVAFEVSPLSLFGNKNLQLNFRVNCSICSVTDKTLHFQSSFYSVLTVPAQVHNSAIIHQEPQLYDKVGLNFNET